MVVLSNFFSNVSWPILLIVLDVYGLAGVGHTLCAPPLPLVLQCRVRRKMSSGWVKKLLVAYHKFIFHFQLSSERNGILLANFIIILLLRSSHWNTDIVKILWVWGFGNHKWYKSFKSQDFCIKSDFQKPHKYSHFLLTCEYIDFKIVPSPSIYMTNCSTVSLL